MYITLKQIVKSILLIMAMGLLLTGCKNDTLASRENADMQAYTVERIELKEDMDYPVMIHHDQKGQVLVRGTIGTNAVFNQVTEDGELLEVQRLYNERPISEHVISAGNDMWVEVSRITTDISGEMLPYVQVTQYDHEGKVDSEYLVHAMDCVQIKDVVINDTSLYILDGRGAVYGVSDYVAAPSADEKKEVKKLASNRWEQFRMDGTGNLVGLRTEVNAAALEWLDVLNEKTIEKVQIEVTNVQDLKYEQGAEVFHILTPDEILAYSPIKNSIEKVVDLRDLVPSQGISRFAMESPESIILLADIGERPILYNVSSSGNSMQTDAASQEVIKVAALQSDNRFLSAAQRFERQQENVRVELLTPGARTDENFLTVLSTDLLTGNGPDLLYGAGLPYADYIKNDRLVDLKQAFPNSACFSSDINQNIVSALEQDEKQFLFPIDYTLQLGMFVNASLKTEKLDAEHITTVAELSDALAILSDENGVSHFVEPYFAYINFLQYIDLNYTDLVNEGEKTAHFESDTFIEVLEAIKGIQAYELTDYNTQPRVMSAHFDGYSAEENQENLWVPYSLDDSGRLAALNPKTVALNATSKKKDLAVRFIEILVSEPVSTEVMEVRSFDMNNTIDAVAKSIAKGASVTVNNVHYHEEPLALNIMETIETVQGSKLAYNLKASDPEFVRILFTEYKALIGDQQTAQETANRLNQKVELYLRENE